LNYGGHVLIPSVIQQRKILIADPIVRDRSDEAQLELGVLYPWMTKYKFSKALAQRAESAK
jgi:hypothetical protein